MKIIEKKAWPKLYEQVRLKNKNFDVRLADVDCTAGDILILKEWDPIKKKYTGRSTKRKIKFVLESKDLEKFWSKSDIKKHGFHIIGF